MSVEYRSGIDLPELPSAHPVRATVAGKLRRQNRAVPPGPRPSRAHWDAGYFGLDAVGAFADAAPEARARILERCGSALLEEAFFIEKAGVGFAAKMIHEAQTIDERKLYALFAADEAAHLEAVSAFYAPDDVGIWQHNPFLKMLDGLVLHAGRESMQLIVQVVLEGWGLVHYRGLRDACREPDLRDALGRILVDEAGHHGSGVALLEGAHLPDATVEYVTEVMVLFLSMVQAGPQMVAGALEQELGGLTRVQRRRAFEELDAHEHTATRLTCLRELMAKVEAARPIIARLDALGCYRPRKPEELA